MELNIVGTFLIASKAAALMAASQMAVDFLGSFWKAPQKMPTLWLCQNSY